MPPQRGAQKQQEQPQAAPTEDVVRPVAKPKPEPKSKLEPEPKSESKLEESKPKSEAKLTPALAGQHVDAAVKVFGGDDPISGVAKVFNQVASTLANVHPYAQAALGILTSFSLLFMNQANLDRAVSDPLDTVGIVYEGLMQENRISNLDEVALAAKIARAISDPVNFIINYSTARSFWKSCALVTFGS
ncbi:hypothetical protein EDD16DRAFT_251101 [Pisolithus croceorrhizus]|nr:hypothetical protein EDD16DRAFT_251101 [Pisolithus croceorrhizus]